MLFRECLPAFAIRHDLPARGACSNTRYLGDRCPKISLIVRVGNEMAAKIRAQVTGYGPQPGNTQVLLIVTLEFDGPSVDDVHGPGTERRR